jgi:prepilin-type N-terminal cleavage/methylation domain-containing protein/prepilin-type processing-associated H-X9-DG protein
MFGRNQPSLRRPVLRREGRIAFTLVELLVVIAIMAILASLVMPALARAKQQGKRAACMSNLRQIGLATGMYVDEHECYPPAYLDSTTRWMDLLKPLIDKSSGVYLCPADPEKNAVTWDPEIFLSYGINTFRFADQGGCFWYGVKAQRVQRPSGVIVFADCTPGKYYCGGGSTFEEPVVDVDYRHPKRSFVAVFCDGHVEVNTQTEQSHWDTSK